MCRWLIYQGQSVVLADVITRPKNSLINQAFHQCYTPGLEPGQSQSYDAKQHHQRNAALNGDGFGVAWYSDIHNQPAVFKSVTPAWNNENLFEIARVIRSSCILAHVRAASTGLGVSEANCHPFRHGHFTFMHNGCIAGFSKIKRHIQSILRDDVYSMIKGSTDSEHMFALIMNFIAEPRGRYTAQQLAQIIEMAISKLLSIQREHGITDPSSMNFALSDGVSIIATRARNDPHSEPPSLYYKVGTNFHLNREINQSRMDGSEDKEFDTIICSSEPLSYDSSWHLMPKDTMLVSTSVEGKPMKYWLKPLDLYSLDSARVRDAWATPMSPEPHPKSLASSLPPVPEHPDPAQCQLQPFHSNTASDCQRVKPAAAASFIRPIPLPRPTPLQIHPFPSETACSSSDLAPSCCQPRDECALVYPPSAVIDESAYRSPRLDLVTPRSPQQPMCSFEFATRRGESESFASPEMPRTDVMLTTSSSEVAISTTTSKTIPKPVASPECKQVPFEFDPPLVKISPRSMFVSSQLLTAAASPLSSFSDASPSPSPSPASVSTSYGSGEHDHASAQVIGNLSLRVAQLEQELVRARRASAHD